jgi:hypothetical protein
MSKSPAQIEREIRTALAHPRARWTIFVRGTNNRVSRYTSDGKPVEFSTEEEAKAVAEKWNRASVQNRYWVEPIDHEE